MLQGILDPFCKVISHCVQHTTLQYKTITDMCFATVRVFSKDRDKHQLCRQLMFDLSQALKFKINIPDNNLLLLVGFLLEDAGGALPKGIVPDLPERGPCHTTSASDCIRQYMNDILDFLADFHTLSKLKNFKNSHDLNEDTLGGVLKGAIAQYLALEMSRGNARDNKAIARYLPWLYNAPAAIQQGPKEFSDCIGHMRLLSWLLMGALTHTALLARNSGDIGQHGASIHDHVQNGTNTVAHPIPQEASCHIADHIQVIFAGFVEQSKMATNVLHMSSLFHAFTLCQLWTVYLEQISHMSAPSSEPHNITMAILFEFWGKVTPCILSLVTTPKPVRNLCKHWRFVCVFLRSECHFIALSSHIQWQCLAAGRSPATPTTSAARQLADVRNGQLALHQPAGGVKRDALHHFDEIAADLESSAVVPFAIVHNAAAAAQGRSRL